MSMWNFLILININIMDMKVHMFIKIFIFMLVSRGKKKIEIIIRMEIIIRKISRKESNSRGVIG
jgi:hypothetical protein